MWKIIDKDLYDKLKLDNLVQISYYNLKAYQRIYPNHWSKLILANFENNKIISLCNCYIINKFFFKILYIPGGIEGKFNENIVSDLKNFLDPRVNYLSIVFINFHNEILNFFKLDKRFKQVINLHETRLVMKKNFSNIENLKLSYTKNWRHNLNRSRTNEFTTKKIDNPNLSELMELYKQMSKLKNYRIFITYNYLQSIFKNLNKKLIHYEVRKDCKLIAFRTCLIHNDKAWDLLACSGIESKNNYCTYFIVNRLFEDLIKLNIKLYDFNGVDLKNNIGVFNFKKGTGAKDFKKIGEYVYANNIILSSLAILFLFIKRIIIK